MDWCHRFEQVDSTFENCATISFLVREGSWYWTHSLEPMDYSDWDTKGSQPDDDLGDENCAMIWGFPNRDHFWNDFHCSYARSHAPYPEGSIFSICQRSLWYKIKFDLERSAILIPILDPHSIRMIYIFIDTPELIHIVELFFLFSYSKQANKNHQV